MIDDDDLDRRLALRGHIGVFDDATLSRLASTSRAEAARTRGLRLAALGISAVIALGAGVAVSPVAADVVRSFLAQSDWNPEPGGEILPDSEWVDVGASDLGEYVDYIYPDYLIPAPGQTREEIVGAVAGMWAGREGLTQEVGLRRDMEIAVFCGWASDWVEAHAVGDEPRAQAAIDGMLLTTTWPALAATDGGGVVDRQIEVIGFASAGDIPSFQFGVAQNGCSSFTPALGDE